MEKKGSKELYVRHKILSRELKENLRLHGPFEKKEDVAEFMAGINTNRKIKLSENSDVGKAYGLVYDAVEYLNRHMDKQGLELVDRALELDPTNEEALMIKMDMLLDYERSSEAETYAEKLIALEALSPDKYASAYLTKAQITVSNAYEVGDRRILASALELVDEGLGADGQNYDLVTLKAGILYQLGRREYRKWLDKARKIDKRRTEMFMEHYWISEKLI